MPKKDNINFRIDSMQEDSKEILGRIGIEEELPFSHKTQGKKV